MKLGDIADSCRSAYSVHEEPDGDMEVDTFTPDHIAEYGYSLVLPGSRRKRYKRGNNQITGQLLKTLDVLVCTRGKHCGRVALVSLIEGQNLIPAPASFIALSFAKPLRAFYAYECLADSKILKKAGQSTQRSVNTISRDDLLNIPIPELTQERAKEAYFRFKVADGVAMIENQLMGVGVIHRAGFEASVDDIIGSLRAIVAQAHDLEADLRSLRKDRKTLKDWQTI